MPAWALILIVVVVVAVVAAVVAWQVMLKSRRERRAALRERFGPEYERMVRERKDRTEAEEELAARIERRQALEIRPLAPAARDRYLKAWTDAQAHFVDAPEAAVASADGLIVAVMRDRGYPVDDFEQRAADLSVDHPELVENYRSARSIADRSYRSEAATEDLRQAMQQYRALFDELLSADGRDETPALAASGTSDDGARTAGEEAVR